MVHQRSLEGRVRFIAVAAAILGGALALLGATGAKPGGPELAGAAPRCVPVKNAYMIIDDSGSMSVTDPEDLRVEAAKILISLAAHRRPHTVLGAGEFATSFSPIFTPQLVTPGNRAALSASIEQKIREDGSDVAGDFGGSTDYNAAFVGAAAADPTADARVFMTDGGHNAGPYLNLHTPGPPTYVLGFGTSSSNAALLQQIADDTGGDYLEFGNVTELQPDTPFELDRLLHCSRTRKFVDDFRERTRPQPYGLGISKGTRSVDVTVSWNTRSSRFKPGRFVLVRHGHRVAKASASKLRKLKVTRSFGGTFVTVHLSGGVLRRGGRLRFRVQARRLSGTQEVTTVVAVNRRFR